MAQAKAAQLEAPRLPPQARTGAAFKETQKLEKKLDRDWESAHALSIKLAQQRTDLNSALEEMDQHDVQYKAAISELH
eukprot:8403054-Pyramimonas_sp.AAC.1